MPIARTTLETTLGCSQSWDGLRLRKLGASVRGSSENSESGGASSGSSLGRSRGTKYKRSANGWEGTRWGLGSVGVGRAIAKKHLSLGGAHSNVACLHKRGSS